MVVADFFAAPFVYAFEMSRPDCFFCIYLILWCFMTRSGLDSMISVLKDRCKKVLEEQNGLVGAAVCCPSSRECKASFPICSDQVVSLTALISYVAHMTGQTEYRVERTLANHFCVANPKCITQDQYDQAIIYMVDQVTDAHC